MARLVRKTNLLPTNLCISWGLYHVRRYRDKTHRIVKVDMQPMVEGSGVDRFDMKPLRAGMKALSAPSIGSTWQKQVEFHMTISNLWD